MGSSGGITNNNNTNKKQTRSVCNGQATCGRALPQGCPRLRYYLYYHPTTSDQNYKYKKEES